MSYTLPEPDVRGPNGSGTYYDAYTVQSTQKIADAAYATGHAAGLHKTDLASTEYQDKARIAELEREVEVLRDDNARMQRDIDAISEGKKL